MTLRSTLKPLLTAAAIILITIAIWPAPTVANWPTVPNGCSATGFPALHTTGPTCVTNGTYGQSTASWSWTFSSVITGALDSRWQCPAVTWINSAPTNSTGGPINASVGFAPSSTGQQAPCGSRTDTVTISVSGPATTIVVPVYYHFNAPCSPPTQWCAFANWHPSINNSGQNVIAFYFLWPATPVPKITPTPSPKPTPTPGPTPALHLGP